MGTGVSELEFLTSRDVCALLKISGKTLERLRKRRALNFVRLAGLTCSVSTIFKIAASSRKLCCLPSTSGPLIDYLAACPLSEFIPGSKWLAEKEHRVRLIFGKSTPFARTKRAILAERFWAIFDTPVGMHRANGAADCAGTAILRSPSMMPRGRDAVYIAT